VLKNGPIEGEGYRMRYATASRGGSEYATPTSVTRRHSKSLVVRVN
jgi:hypothetical protein